MLRATIFAAAAALATSAAFAQTSANPSGNPPAPPIPPAQMTNPMTPSTTAPAAEAVSDTRVSHLVGLNIKNTANETVGEIEDIILDDKMMMKGFIVSVGGFLGLGERHVAVAPADLKFVRASSGNAVTATMNATKESLKAMPQYKYLSSWRAETATAPSTATSPPAARAPAAPPAMGAAPAPTAAMTEDQARAAIAAAGYTKVDGLMRDSSGHWRGQATREGKVVAVMIDPQGRVVVQ